MLVCMTLSKVMWYYRHGMHLEHQYKAYVQATAFVYVNTSCLSHAPHHVTYGHGRA